MTPDQAVAYIEGICKAASKAGITLRLDPTADGYEWEWSNGWSGDTTANVKHLALLYACEDYAAHREQEQIQRHFDGMKEHFKQ